MQNCIKRTRLVKLGEDGVVQFYSPLIYIIEEENMAYFDKKHQAVITNFDSKWDGLNTIEHLAKHTRFMI